MIIAGLEFWTYVYRVKLINSGLVPVLVRCKPAITEVCLIDLQHETGCCLRKLPQGQLPNVQYRCDSVRQVIFVSQDEIQKSPSTSVALFSVLYFMYVCYRKYIYYIDIGPCKRWKYILNLKIKSLNGLENV